MCNHSDFAFCAFIDEKWRTQYCSADCTTALPNPEGKILWQNQKAELQNFAIDNQFVNESLLFFSLKKIFVKTCRPFQEGPEPWSEHTML